MTVTSDFLAWAQGGSANVITQGAFAALGSELTNGASSGIVPSNLYNKLLRQTTAMVSMIGAFMVAQGQNATDNGNASTLLTNFEAALTTFILSVATAGRIKLTGTANYYVTTTGNDSTGTGAVGAPWLTIQHALNYVMDNIDLAGNSAVINVANGTYSAGAQLNGTFTGGGGVNLVGNTTTPGSCIINLGSTPGAVAFLIAGGAAINMEGFKITGTGSGSSAIDVNTNGYVNIIGNMEFGAIGGSQINCQDSGSIVQISTSAYLVSGAAAAHLSAAYGGQIEYGTPCTITITGTPAFSAAFVTSVLGGIVLAGNETFSGSATGVRYNVASNGIINTNGGGSTYFPGGTSGTSSTGGQYV